MSIPSRNIIICGSRKYDNVCFDELVDSFDVIVRNNMLVPNHGCYGKRESDIQPLNHHVYSKYAQRVNLKGWQRYEHLYKHDNLKEWQRYEHLVGMPREHIEEFLNYLDSCTNTKFVSLPNNNTEIFINFFKKNNFNIQIQKQIRTGLSYVGECLKQEKKPFLIGFSLKEGDFHDHQYLGKIEDLSEAHNMRQEIEIIKILHDNNFIDASFCCVDDHKTLTIDNSVINPTDAALKILIDLFHKLEKRDTVST